MVLGAFGHLARLPALACLQGGLDVTSSDTADLQRLTLRFEEPFLCGMSTIKSHLQMLDPLQVCACVWTEGCNYFLEQAVSIHYSCVMQSCWEFWH
jgi:hypothetical protein